MELLRYRKSEIQKMEIIGENFYYSCIDNNDILIKEDSKPIIISIGGFLLTVEKEEISEKELKKQGNIYICDCKNFNLKITTVEAKNVKIVKNIRANNQWESLKNIFKL